MNVKLMLSIAAFTLVLSSCGDKKSNSGTTPTAGDTNRESSAATATEASRLENLSVEASLLNDWRLNREFKSEENCIQLNGPLSTADVNFAGITCPAKGTTLEGKNIAFTLHARPLEAKEEPKLGEQKGEESKVADQKDQEPAAAPEEKDEAKLQEQGKGEEPKVEEPKLPEDRRYQLILKTEVARPSDQSGKQEDQKGQGKEETEMVPVEVAVGEFVVKTRLVERVMEEPKEQGKEQGTEQGKEQAEQGKVAEQEQGKDQTEQGKLVDQAEPQQQQEDFKRIEMVQEEFIELTALCSGTYADACEVMFDNGHFSGIKALNVELKEEGKDIAQGEAKEQGKEQSDVAPDSKEQTVPAAPAPKEQSQDKVQEEPKEQEQSKVAEDEKSQEEPKQQEESKQQEPTKQG